MDSHENNNLKLIEEIPNAQDYQENKIKHKSNWFNNCLVFLILVLFVLLGIIIAVAVSL